MIFFINKDPENPNYFKRVVYTTWINYEVEKIVSTFYFIIILVLLIFILSNPVHYYIYINFISFKVISTNTNKVRTVQNTNYKIYSTIPNKQHIISIFIFQNKRTYFYIIYNFINYNH